MPAFLVVQTRTMRRLLGLFMGCLPLWALAQPTTDPQPAFLDKRDEVTVALAEPARIQELEGAVRVTINDQPVRVVEIKPGAKAEIPLPPNAVTLPGSIQKALGGNEWAPNDPVTQMNEVRPGVFEFVAAFPAGDWEYKVARGGNWSQNWGRDFVPGGPNIRLSVANAGTIVKFVVDFNANTVKDSINHAGEVVPPKEAPPVGLGRPDADLLGSVRVLLAAPLDDQQLTEEIRVRIGGNEARRVYLRDVLNDPAFQYTKTDLGSVATSRETTFKVWSPVARSATVLLYRTGRPTPFRRVPMKRGTGGVWYASQTGNLHATEYQYEFESYGRKRVATDIYGRASNALSTRSVVVDLSRTQPPGWPTRLAFTGAQTDAVIYELHVRDYTIQAASGVPASLRGKYLGLLHSSSPRQGLNHLVNLGVTHVHLLPIHDFNPAHSQGYNWGYETTQFNVLEEQYSQSPNDAIRRIREFKTMVAGMHKARLGVVLDVVYNHSVPSEGQQSAFWETVPFFYFRTNDRGDVLNESGVGNALADERPMVRKFIRDSLVYWTREYRVDGFRFDLLGMHEPESVADWTKAIRAVNPNAIIYGEPWTGGGPLRFGKGAQRGMGLAVFNDNFRGAWRGALDEKGPGWAMGGGDRSGIVRGMMGSPEFANHPTETLNYVSAHDNLSFGDRVAMELVSPEMQEYAVKFAHAGVLLSQGVPFIEGGIEIGRTKGGNNNSYNAGDPVNQYDWVRAEDYWQRNAYFTRLIALRRAHPVFRLRTKAEVDRLVKEIPADQLPPQTVGFRLDGAGGRDTWKDVIVLFHAGMKGQRVTLPEGKWNVGLDEEVMPRGRVRQEEGEMEMRPLTAYVLYR